MFFFHLFEQERPSKHERPPQRIVAYAYKGDLTRGFLKTHNIKLWRRVSRDKIQIFQRIDLISSIPQVFVEFVGLVNLRFFCCSAEQNLMVQLEHVEGNAFRVMNLLEIEDICKEIDFSSFGLLSSQELLGGLEADNEDCIDLTI